MNQTTKTPGSTRLNCFSPPVMLATFVIEVYSALVLLMYYRANRSAKLMMAILICLAIFQLAEYNVCEGAFGLSSLDYARVGYAAITALPPLGMHLIMSIAGRINRPLLYAAYGSAVLFGLYFLFSGHGVTVDACLGNYVIFVLLPYAGNMFTVYYYGWLLTGIAVAWRLQRGRERRIRQALLGMMAGYATFIVPTAIANMLDPATLRGIPSIMCGFAVCLALVIMFYVAPRVLEPRPRP